MRIAVLHRVPDSLVRYGDAIDHEQHDVTYVGTAERLASLSPALRARRIARPGTGDTAAEVLAALVGLPRPDLVIALSEYDLLAAAQVRAALDVPGDREADVLPVRDKVTMKAAVAAAGLRVPRFSPLADVLAGRDTAWAGRTILKPRAGASSEGVQDLDSVAAALAVARAQVPAHAVADFEVEEFVEGPIIHVDGIAVDGRPAVVQASRYVGTCLGFAEGLPLGSVQIDATREIVDWSVRSLAAVGVRTGPFHLEGIESPNGLVFLEVGARFGGADVVDTFELATGVRLPTAQLRMLVSPGCTPSSEEGGPDRRFGWFVWPGHHLGTPYCRISDVGAYPASPVVHRWVQRPPDEPVRQAITYADADVPLAGIVGPASSAALEDFLTEIFAKVRVEPAGPAELS